MLVIGAGSAGRRHARNLSSLGVAVACYDPRPDRTAELQRELPEAQIIADLGAALQDAYSGAVVASPPAFHVGQAAACVQHGVPVLLEKPVAPTLADALRLQRVAGQARVPILVGYTYRWWPPLQHVRERLREGVLGPVRHARFVMSAHLADWHPWERYQDFFMARRALGGGALLDESHFIDIMLWLFGMPDAVTGSVEHISTLEIDTDDNVDVLVEYANGLRATIHLDLFGRPHRKSIVIACEAGSIECRFDPHVVREYVHGQTPTCHEFGCERNDMFMAEASDFVAVAEGRGPLGCTLPDGIAVLRVVEAVRRSSALRRTVLLSEMLPS
jgi:predicted dehydrogenase